jgi:hypothetical protein
MNLGSLGDTTKGCAAEPGPRNVLFQLSPESSLIQTEYAAANWTGHDSTDLVITTRDWPVDRIDTGFPLNSLSLAQ